MEAILLTEPSWGRKAKCPRSARRGADHRSERRAPERDEMSSARDEGPLRKQQETTMATTTTLKQVSCAPECGFNLRSHDEPELVYFVISHARNVHNKPITEREVRALIQPAS